MRLTFKTAAAGALVIAAVTTASGCGSSTAPTSQPLSTTAPSPSAGSASAAGAPVLEIKNFAFNSVSVKAGRTVMVKNDDAESHTVTSRQAGAFDDMATASSTTMFTAPSAPGQYPFYCKYHGNMKGVLTVT